ncbi:Rhodanese-like sulfurtransferase [Blastococcus saxobsidens DD2]|uniref:Rhodanese-like sulfurtransferase n=1 Tax=Blastococcus saxobsidens (strain DD2) TaxID=1146883 RepID=H6RMD5_BLASD|nr:Rhodanese-like sulfurtransferase [Blastococcus saxobsidens DD2]
MGAELIDVRTPVEFDAAHVPGAVNIPLDELRGQLDELHGMLHYSDVVLVCRSGARAGQAQQALRRPAWPTALCCPAAWSTGRRPGARSTAADRCGTSSVRSVSPPARWSSPASSAASSRPGRSGCPASSAAASCSPRRPTPARWGWPSPGCHGIAAAPHPLPARSTDRS